MTTRLLAILAAVLVMVGCSTAQTRSDSDYESDRGERPTMGISADANSGYETKDFDLNGDNVADLIKYYEHNSGEPRLVRKDADLNFDGKTDVWIMYDAGGQKSVERFDLDFDGRVDLAVYYKDGAMTRKEIDFQFDERPDIWKFYANGKLIRREMDTTKDGQADYWEYYDEDGVVVRVGRDTDGDGQIDVEENPQSGKVVKPNADNVSGSIESQGVKAGEAVQE